ncbi:ATP-binding protein [Thioalkalivibrio sp.]|uniref:ATP-binding protein n=1 Tax=Thioalkalivibrio sp. TaxID=2093813 RepID=UPI003975323D
MRRLLGSAGMAYEVFEDPAAFCTALTREPGVLLMNEEALSGTTGARVQQLLATQEDWSSIPLIVLTRGTLAYPAGQLLHDLEAHGGVTLVERPVRLAVLATVVRMAVADRLKQYRVRDLLAERAEAIGRRDDFLAMLGHELRNPLGAVSVCTEVLMQAPNSLQADECTQIIQTQTQDMKRLLDDLLDISRLTRGQLALRREPVELGRILGDVVTQLAHKLEGRDQRIALHQPQGELLLQGDPTRLRQIFANLLSNASRYSPPETEVTFSVERAATNVLVCVRDQGRGMTPQTIDRVFEPFWQGADCERHGGLGIGLTLAHRLVEMHGGRLEARSDGPGLGSELRVSLPLDQQPPTTAPAPEKSTEILGRRVLVIDDNRDLAFGIQFLLGRKGYQVELAGSGAEGIAAAERQRPDVILLDIGLPDINGFEVARRLRGMPALQGVRLIGMSGFGSDEHHRRSQATGMDRFLTKPVTAVALAEAVAAGA